MTWAQQLGARTWELGYLGLQSWPHLLQLAPSTRQVSWSLGQL